MSESEDSNLFNISNRSLEISGNIVNASNGYPLIGLPITGLIVIGKVRSPSNSAKIDLKREFLIGEDISDFNGRFNLLLKTKNVIPFLPFLTQDEKLSFILRLNDNNNKPSTIQEYPLDLQTNFVQLTLNVSLPKSQISHSMWKDLVSRMRRARLIQIHQLARQLGSMMPKQSLFGDLNIQLRQSIITELEKAFLDPDGILTKISEIPGSPMARSPKQPGSVPDWSRIWSRELRPSP